MKAADYKEALEMLANKCAFVENRFSDINLFGVLGIQRNEVLICRVLGFLLMPNSVEGIGIKPLQLFLNQINCNRAYTNQELQAASVVLEEHIDNDRRVDIVIYVGRDVYPIEVKVDAEDQPAQLFDYYYYFKEKKKNKIEKIYYLTPNRRCPSVDSMSSRKRTQQKQLSRDVVECLSFESDIKQWLDKLIQICPENNNYMFLLKQFEDVIKTMCASNSNQNALYGALGLTDLETFEVSKATQALLNIMNLDQKALWFRVRDGYLRKALKLNSKDGEEKYKLADTPEGAEIDKHSLYVIKHVDTEKEIAWICVETNLYIVSKCHVEYLHGADGYFWKYLSPNGSAEKFQLHKPNTSITDGDRIELEALLSQIKAALDSRE